MLYREEILPYKRVKGSTKPVTEKKIRIISTQVIILYIAAFFIARVFMLEALMPFGIAFFVAAYAVLNIEATFITGGIIILGYFSTFNGYLSISHIISVVMLMLVMVIFKNKDKNRILKMGFASFIINAVTYIFFHIKFITGTLIMYDVILAILESTIIMASAYIFIYGMPIYFESKKRRILSKEEMICLSFILAVIVAGIWNIEYMGVSLRNIVTLFIILGAGYVEGPGLGAAWGTILGMVLCLSSVVVPTTVGMFGFVGLMAGVFKNMGKIICAISFVISYVIAMIYIIQTGSAPPNILGTIIPIVVFLIIPDNKYVKIANVIDNEKKDIEFRATYIEKVKDLMDKKLSILSGTLSGLSEVLSKNIDSELTHKSEINGMVENLADKVCISCDKSSTCWKRDFYNSYDSFSELLWNIEKLGKIGFNDIPQILKNKCVRPNELIKQSNYIFEIFRLNNKWKKKLINSKIIVSEQVKGISEIMKSMTEEIGTSMDFRNDIEQEIAVSLDRNGLEFEDILTIKNNKGKYEVTIYKKPCAGKQECNKEFVRVVSRTLGVKMVRESGKCKINNDCSICQFRFVEAENYSIVTAVSRMAKEEVSGDNYTYGSINDGRYLIALSDGMGSGVRAAIESNTTISLLEKFLEAGFDRNTALKAINSVLVLRSCEESFATVDMGVIDLHSGIGEFVKIGSAPTFIKSGMEVDVIKSTSIPVGILDEIEIESQILDFKSGDMIVMVTDGVIDAHKEHTEGWIIRALKEFDSGNPKDVSDYILNKAKSLYGNEIGDDMTVIVSKIWKLF